MSNEKKSTHHVLIFFGIFGLIIVLSAFTYYEYIFHDFTIDANVADFGMFGDFMGGTLNPILAFLSFIALLYTIKIQIDELEETRKELKDSRIAQQEQSESLQLQNKATEIQIFENTFFKLLELFIETRNTIKSGRETTGQPAIANILNFLNSDINKKKESQEIKYIYDNFNIKWQDKTGVFFSQIYQIMKFIDNKSIIENKSFYINILRAQFTKKEIEFIYYHCLGSIGERKFKKYVEKYEFFEHIILDENIEKYLLKYEINAFGDNEKVISKHNELRQK